MKKKVYWIVYERLKKKYPKWSAKRIRYAAIWICKNKFNKQYKIN